MKFGLVMPIAIKEHDTKRAKMLIECLNSILCQTHQDWHLIMKDAFPATPVIYSHPEVLKYMSDSRIHYKIMADTGIADGINQALYRFSDDIDIFHFICGDDKMGDSGTMEYVNECFKCWARNNPSSPAWMYGNIEGINEDSSYFSGANGTGAVFATLDELLIHNRMGQPTVFWNRAMFERIGYFDSTYARAEEYEYWCRCYRIQRPMFTSRTIGVGRRWSESLSHIDCDFVEREATRIAAYHSVAHKAGEHVRYIPYTESR